VLETQTAPHGGRRHIRAGRLGGLDPVAWLMMLVPAAVAAVTGGDRLGQPALWRDEAATKEIAGRPISQILATLPHDDAEHGFYYILIHLTGTSSELALRLPSLIAMVVASACTALIAGRLADRAGGADQAGGSRSWLTGMVAGVLFAMAPSTVSYAQLARSYAIVTMCATIATLVLLKAVTQSGRGWWVAYGAVILLTGMFNLFGLLLALCHGVSLAVARRTGDLRRWLVAAVAAGVLLIPVAIGSYSQRGALNWMSQNPHWWRNFVVFLQSGPGSSRLAALAAVLALAGIAVEVTRAKGRLTLGPAAVAAPWLLVPPVLLLTVSQMRPVWDIRYVEFCVPAFAILIAWGLDGLARLAAASLRVPKLAWIPMVAATVAGLVAVAPAVATARSSRPDNLRAEAAIIARHARPGDVVIYFPVNDRIVSMPYPGPFEKLRDIALATPPAESDTLYGTDVTPAQLRERWVNVTRVWVVTSSEVNYFSTGRATPLDLEERRLIAGMRVIGHWRDGDTELILYSDATT
jgi:mannosyltransferase